jgi:hypothetical protein
LQIESVVAVTKKVEARSDGRSPKEHEEPECIVTSETVIQSRDKEHDWTDLREQSHMEQPTLPCRRNIGPSGFPKIRSGGKKGCEGKQLVPDDLAKLLKVKAKLEIIGDYEDMEKVRDVLKELSRLRP